MGGYLGGGPAMGVQPGAANDFNKIIWKTVRGSFVLQWDDGEAASVDARNGRLGVPVGLGTAVGLIMFAADYNSAAGVMFEVSNDDANYFPLDDSADGSRIEYKFTAGEAIALDPVVFDAWDFIRVVLSDGAGNEVNSSGTVNATLVVKRT